ncbi:hypothetical protein [Kribbella sp. NPDC055071]
MSRTLARSLLAGGGGTLAVPLALAPAARIQERAWPGFLDDATQLANGLRDLVDAIGPDGVAVSNDDVLVEQAAGAGLAHGPHALAAVEATGRLRQSLGDRVALVAVLPGPGRSPDTDVDAVNDLAKRFLAAGVDVLVIRTADVGADLGTLANIARFHQALAVAYDEPASGLPLVSRVPVRAPVSRAGVVLTDCHLDRDIDFSHLEDWVADVH